MQGLSLGLDAEFSKRDPRPSDYMFAESRNQKANDVLVSTLELRHWAIVPA